MDAHVSCAYLKLFKVKICACILRAETEIDRHPEKRVKAAFETFQDARLSYLKMENPNLRLSQLKQIVKKEWQKSTENPLNHRLPS